MPSLALRGVRDLEALVVGASAFACGGGGDPRAALELLASLKVKRIEVYELTELGEELVAAVYSVGPVGAGGARERLEPAAEALRLLEKWMSCRISGLMPVELGGGAVALPVALASEKRLAVVDADRVGRAAPEIHQDILVLRGRRLCPAAVASRRGTTVLVESYASEDEYEALLRSLSTSSGSSVVVVDGVLKASEALKLVLTGSVSRCYEVGLKVLQARERGSDPAKALAEALEGWLVFKGVVKSWGKRVERGFLWGELVIEGVEEWEGKVLRTWVKNEHLAAWLGDELLAAAPDIVVLVGPDGLPLHNSRLEPGLRVSCVVARGPSVWRTPEGLELFGPQRFGLSVEYVPVEKLVERLGLA